MTKKLTEIPFSVLDLVPIGQGSSAQEALHNSLELAQHAEQLGFHRYWIAEHHNMPGIASSATSVVIGHIAAGTSTIRVGAGGIMLPNHAPLVIAEQFGTLESLFPGRIDLGLGRAPGSDQTTARALRRDRHGGLDFPHQLAELRGYFDPSLATEQNQVRAIPGEGLSIPIYLLGSSDFSARLAGQLGLPFAFASHFSPDFTAPAIQLYRQSFQPSAILNEPYCMVAVNVIVAESDDEAQRLSTSMQQSFLHLIRNQPAQLQPPVEDISALWLPHEKQAIERQLAGSIIGSSETVEKNLGAFIDLTDADEIIANAMIYDHQARLSSYQLLAELVQA
ncbi:luciferase [Ammoniphilus oxalaticus]|uniref:Luciferase n=1 Tax=Ammoniphilus oxalaticus TaxID=66863 RepID=A0A419SM23_9BACL|nr:LLM class flavin-dependent oxidoreductase [Ammoniphilus oxalaticus]RKD25065.1 luciferase [Ammoniphilus oxalaticus]